MNVSVKTKGVVLTSKQKAQVEKQLGKLKKFLNHIDPVTVEVTFIDQSGPAKGGKDQAVHINMTLPKETIFIEELSDRAARSFQLAYKNLERRLRQYSEKMVDNKRRASSKFKAMANVVGGAGRAVSGTLGRLVKKRS